MPNSPCSNPQLKKNPPELSQSQVVILGVDVANARQMVETAKTYTDKIPWNDGTQAISNKYFGNSTQATQTLMRQNVNNVLSLLNGVNSVTSTFYPAGSDLLGAPEKSGYFAYVDRFSDVPRIFLGAPFWQEPATGADSQAGTIVHELSHMQAGASTVDYIYGKTGCEVLVYLSAHPLAMLLTDWTVDPPPADAPVNNADSFMYFVYYVAAQANRK